MDPAELRQTVADLSTRMWGLAALGAVLERDLVPSLAGGARPAELAERAGAPEALVARLLDVLVALGLARRDDGVYRVDDDLATRLGTVSVRADVRSTLLQATQLFADARGDGALQVGWNVTDPEILEAQGEMSAGAVDLLQRVVFPSVPGLEERLQSPGSAFLDVGVGVAAVTIELCRRYPRLRAVGLEPQDAPLALARRNVAAAGLEDRVELRRALVEDLADEAAFDVVWMPGNFLPAAVLGPALSTVLRALRPGGIVLLATLGGGGDDLPAATARLKATLWGGDAVEPEALRAMLETAGFDDIVMWPRLPSSLLPMRARRPL